MDRELFEKKIKIFNQTRSEIGSLNVFQTYPWQRGQTTDWVGRTRNKCRVQENMDKRDKSRWWPEPEQKYRNKMNRNIHLSSEIVREDESDE